MKNLYKAIEDAGNLRKDLESIEFEKLGKDREESAGLTLKYLEKAKEVIDIRDDLLELLGGAK